MLPDTQYYTQKYPDNFKAQTRWIADNYRKRNLAAQFGDLDKDWMLEDRDLQNVRKLPWFAELLKSSRRSQPDNLDR